MSPLDRIWDAFHIVAGLLFFGGLYLFFWRGRERRHIREHHADEIERDAAKLRRAHQVKDGGNLSAHPGTAKRLREGRR